MAAVKKIFKLKPCTRKRGVMRCESRKERMKKMKQNMYLPEGMRLGTLENREAVSSLSSLERAMNQGTILEGMAVLCDHSLNLRVEVGSFIGWIPREETV